MTEVLDRSLIGIHRKIVASALLAPSAENTQPWHFESDGVSLKVFLDRTRTLASDVDFMLDLTGMGASIENAVIASRESGFEPRVDYAKQLQQGKDGKLSPVASIVLEEEGQPDPLFGSLSNRCTSRRMGTTPIGIKTLNELSEHILGFTNASIDWVTEPKQMARVAKLVGLGNRIRFEYEPFHREFYNNIRCSQKEVLDSRDGLDLATLQLPLGVSTILKGLRRWRRMAIANVLGFSRCVARQAAAEVRSSGALGILTVEEPSLKCFLDGGRALERVWLAATQAGLGFHPAAALAVFLAYAERTDGSGLLPHHWRMACEMKRQFQQSFPALRGRTVQMVFRLGYADVPRVRSLRRPLADVLELSR